MSSPLRVLSLGAGVQSTTVALLSAKGTLPTLDACVFADTGWEPKAVYEHLNWLTDELARHCIPVYRVSMGNLRNDILKRDERRKSKIRVPNMPLYVLSPKGKSGMILRQCTQVYKIEPIERFVLRTLLKQQPRAKRPQELCVQLWFGISADEPQRMRDSNVTWKRHIYPLCGVPSDLLPKPMKRQDCISWLQRAYPHRSVPRSACIGCPYHSDAEWRDMKLNRPQEWTDAVEFDAAIRKCSGMRGDVFLHAKRIPLSEVDLTTLEDAGQLSMFRQECQGMCGV